MKIASSNINNVRRRPLNLAMARSGETTDAIVDMKPQPESSTQEVPAGSSNESPTTTLRMAFAFCEPKRVGVVMW